MDEIAKLITGITHFQQQHYGENPELANALKSEQNPKSLLIGCSDSRVDPALLTNSAPGDLFMVRNVANLVPPYEQSAGYHGVSSALEYAVIFLEVSNIIVLGHSGCGGIASLLEMAKGKVVGEFIGKWVDIATPARDKVLAELADRPPEEQARACEREAILVSLQNLMTFPWIRSRVEQQQLSLHGWYFNIGTGQLKHYCAETDSFEVLVKRYASG
jgi:carbonic anhydrase